MQERSGKARSLDISRLREELHFVEAKDGQRLALSEVQLPDREPAPDAPVFLLLHGFAQNRHAFILGPMPDTLLELGGRVFLAELRGHGRSAVESGVGWSMETHLDIDCPALIDGVLQRTNQEKLHFVGHSMGGLLGCALLARDAPFASLTAVATPLLLGAASPLVRTASFFLGPFTTIAPRPRRVPVHHLLRWLSKPLSSASAPRSIQLLQRLTRLANPEAADPEAIKEILATADPESPKVMEALARNAVLLRPRISTIDLVDAVRSAPIPIAGIVGTADIFAPRAAIATLDEDGHAGPRRVIEIDGVSHVDAAMGYHVPETMTSIWDFLLSR